MTIFIDPYHTTAGVILDMTKTVTPLKETTIRDSMTGTNLQVRTINGVTPVFITGCRDSERAVPSFAHPIFVKNFNGRSYLFTDMTLFVSSGANLDTLSTHIRRKEEFDFTKARAIASLVWAAGDTDRFKGQLSFAGDVFSAWMGQTLSRAFALDFVATNKVQMIALAYWESLFQDGAIVFSENEEARMVVAQKASRNWRVPITTAMQFYKDLDVPMASIEDFCVAVVRMLDNVNLNPLPNRPETGFNIRVLLNLIADAWYSSNSKPILATSLEHPPTLCAIIYYCINYNNFKRQQLGQTIQSVGRGGKAEGFNRSFTQLIEEMTRPEVKPISVMEYLNPDIFHDASKDDTSAVSKLMDELINPDEEDELNKIIETSEDFGVGTFANSFNEVYDSTLLEPKHIGVESVTDAALAKTVLSPNDTVDGRPTM